MPEKHNFLLEMRQGLENYAMASNELDLTELMEALCLSINITDELIGCIDYTDKGKEDEDDEW